MKSGSSILPPLPTSAPANATTPSGAPHWRSTASSSEPPCEGKRQLTPAQRIWLGVLQKMALAYPMSAYATADAPQLISMATTWADELDAIADAEVAALYRETMQAWTSSFPPSVGDFRAAWNRVLAACPRKTYQQSEAEQALHRLPEAPPNPLLSRLFRSRAEGVVCHCRHDRGADDTRRPALLVARPGGPRFVCAQNQCDFDLDAIDENAEPAPIPGALAKVAAASPTLELTPAQKLALAYGLNYESLDEKQTMRLRQLAHWLGDDLEAAQALFPSLMEAQIAWRESGSNTP